MPRVAIALISSKIRARRRWASSSIRPAWRNAWPCSASASLLAARILSSMLCKASSALYESKADMGYSFARLPGGSHGCYEIDIKALVCMSTLSKKEAWGEASYITNFQNSISAVLYSRDRIRMNNNTATAKAPTTHATLCASRLSIRRVARWASYSLCICTSMLFGIIDMLMCAWHCFQFSWRLASRYSIPGHPVAVVVALLSMVQRKPVLEPFEVVCAVLYVSLQRFPIRAVLRTVYPGVELVEPLLVLPHLPVYLWQRDIPVLWPEITLCIIIDTAVINYAAVQPFILLAIARRGWAYPLRR